MVSQQVVDRRQRRRQQTIDEIVDLAAAIMAEQGAGRLSLSEVARRMGVRPPSLYVYFDSKNALYDGLFQRGWSLLNQTMAPYLQALENIEDVRAHVLESMRAFVRWAVENPAYAQLMFWRPVPGYEPTPEAYVPAIESMRAVTELVTALRDRGVLRGDVDLDEAAAACTVLISGVISQQLANAPHESFDEGTFTRLLPRLLALYLAGYGPDGGTDEQSDAGTRSRGRAAADGAGGRDNRRARAVHGDAGPAARSR